MADRVVLLVTVIFGSLFALQNNPLWLILCGFFITVQRPADLQLPLLSIRDLPDPHPRPRRRFLLLLQPAVDGVQQHHYRHYLAVRRLAGGDRVYRRQHADRDAGDRVVRPENARHRSGKHLTFCAGGAPASSAKTRDHAKIIPLSLLLRLPYCYPVQNPIQYRAGNTS